MRSLAEAMAPSIASLLISIPPQLNPQLLGDLAALRGSAAFPRIAKSLGPAGRR
jgi:hypothetical protein